MQGEKLEAIVIEKNDGSTNKGFANYCGMEIFQKMIMERKGAFGSKEKMFLSAQKNIIYIIYGNYKITGNGNKMMNGIMNKRK